MCRWSTPYHSSPLSTVLKERQPTCLSQRAWLLRLPANPDNYFAMHYYFRFVFLFIFLMMMGCRLVAQDPAVLKGLVTGFFRAIEEKDIARMRTLTTPDFVLFED